MPLDATEPLVVRCRRNRLLGPRRAEAQELRCRGCASNPDGTQVRGADVRRQAERVGAGRNG